MSEIGKLQKDVAEIKTRNKRVELDKAWETSLTRRIFIAVSTYLLIALFMVFIGVDSPFLSAIVPALGYLLSTLSVGIVKKYWMKKRETNNPQA